MGKPSFTTPHEPAKTRVATTRTSRLPRYRNERRLHKCPLSMGQKANAQQATAFSPNILVDLPFPVAQLQSSAPCNSKLHARTPCGLTPSIRFGHRGISKRFLCFCGFWYRHLVLRVLLSVFIRASFPCPCRQSPLLSWLPRTVATRWCVNLAAVAKVPWARKDAVRGIRGVLRNGI